MRRIVRITDSYKAVKVPPEVRVAAKPDIAIGLAVLIEYLYEPVLLPEIIPRFEMVVARVCEQLW
jgi:hypothetical protein